MITISTTGQQNPNDAESEQLRSHSENDCSDSEQYRTEFAAQTPVDGQTSAVVKVRRGLRSFESITNLSILPSRDAEH